MDAATVVPIVRTIGIAMAVVAPPIVVIRLTTPMVTVASPVVVIRLIPRASFSVVAVSVVDLH